MSHTMQELLAAARDYYTRYCQDEADGSEWVCEEDQRRAAQRLRDAIKAAERHTDQPSAVPDFKTWREHELRYVCEAMRDISRQNGEAARESANDVLAWAENRLRAADNAAAAPQPSAALRAYYETHEPPHCPTCGCGTADNGTAGPT